MTFRVGLAFLAVCGVGYYLSTWRIDDSTRSFAAEPGGAKLIRDTTGRQQGIESAVRGYFSASGADARRAYVRREPFVDAELDRQFGTPSAIEEVGQMTQHDTTLTMVRARFEDGYVSLLLEELASGRFVVDSETANPEESAAWPNFRARSSTVPEAFRLYVSLSDYYNFEFQKRAYVAFQLEIPGSEDKVTGYVKRASSDGKQILEALRAQVSVPMILSLQHPEAPHGPTQILIDRWIQNDWIIVDEAVAPAFGERELVSR